MTDRDDPQKALQQSDGAITVAPLSAISHVRVAEGEPDIRGWEVVGQDRLSIGTVHDLVVDSNALKVRYVDVEIRPEAFQADRERHVLIPVGYARLDEDDDRILVNNIAITAAGTLPEYGHTPVTRDEEVALHEFYAAASPAAGAMPERSEDYYGHERFDDSRFWGKRDRAAHYLERR